MNTEERPEMVWFKVDDGLHSHPKAYRAGTAALGLWVRCGSWSAEYLTDGFVPESIAQAYGTARMRRSLLEACLWRVADGGYVMHDWLDRNPSRADIEATREAQHEAKVRAGTAGGRASGAARRRSRAEAEPKQPASLVVEANGKQNEAPTRPDPTRNYQRPSDVVAAPAAKPKPATRIPDSFPLCPALLQWGREHAPLVNGKEETDNWIDWHLSKGDTAKDWTASWRTWMRRAQKDAERGTGRALSSVSRTRPSTSDAAAQQAIDAGARFAAKLATREHA